MRNLAAERYPVALSPEARKKLKTFAIGIGVRLAGLPLILLGDGHDTLWAKALVIAGVIITVAGMSILRFMLFQPLLTKLRPKKHPPQP